MLSPQSILDTYYLEARRDLLEVAALLDRYDESVKRETSPAMDESKLVSLMGAIKILSLANHPQPNRVEQLLKHFAEAS